MGIDETVIRWLAKQCYIHYQKNTAMLLSKTRPYLFLPVLIALACSTPKSTKEDKAPAAATVDLLVGTYTGSGSRGIYQLQFNPATGELSDSVLLAATNNPSYLVINQSRSAVFAVNETTEGGITSFRWDREADTLVQVSSVPSKGAHPCYVDLSGDEQLLAVANYSSGNLAVYAVSGDAGIGEEPVVVQHEGSGPVAPNQKGPHAHCSIFRDGFLYAVDLGIDKVLAYPVQADGTLGAATTAFQLQPGDGPRHLIFHPTQPMAFVVNELSSSVVSLAADFDQGVFREIDRASTLPDGFAEKNADADVHLSPDGRFLYASNRGHNSLAVFSVGDTGTLTALGHEPVRGNWPRNFTLSPDGRFVLVANQESGNIVVFSRNEETGLLSFTGHEFAVSKPVCLKF